MTDDRSAPTRSSLLRGRHRLERVRKGVDLLTRKRRALVADLFRIASPAIEARRRVVEQSDRAHAALLAALTEHGSTLAALGWPTRQLEIEVTAGETWGVPTGAIRRLMPVRRSLPGRGLAPGWTGPSARAASDAFEEFVELVLDAASHEILLRRLAEALARTSRQVNTLEQRVTPRLEADIRRIREVLEEREREERARLKHLLRRRGAGR